MECFIKYLRKVNVKQANGQSGERWPHHEPRIDPLITLVVHEVMVPGDKIGHQVSHLVRSSAGSAMAKRHLSHIPHQKTLSYLTIVGLSQYNPFEFNVYWGHEQLGLLQQVSFKVTFFWPKVGTVPIEADF